MDELSEVGPENLLPKDRAMAGVPNEPEGVEDESTMSASEVTVEGDETEAGEPKKYPYNGIIVFGHGYRGTQERLSQEARIRVLAACELWKSGVAPKIIVTGGQPSATDKEKFGDDLLSNGELMRGYLVDELGVPEDAVVFENQSTKTVDNVGHALNELQQQGLPTDDFVTVSTGYHMQRISSIMEKFGLRSAPVPAEEGLRLRAEEHARKMRQRDIEKGLSSEEVEKNYKMRSQRYDRYMEKMRLEDPAMVAELENEEKWQEAMNDWGYWGPLALAVRGPKLKEIVEQNKDDIEAWLQRHPDIDLTVADLIEGNYDYMELVSKGREVPQ